MKTEIKNLDYYLSLPYTVVLRRDEEGDWLARIDELQGCIAHAGTQAEALTALDEIRKAWLEDAIENHDPIPEPFADEELPSGKWVQRVPRSLHKRLVELAEQENVSLNQFATSILAEAVGRKSQQYAVASPRTSHDWGGWVEFIGTAHHGGVWKIDQPPVHRSVSFVEALKFARSQIENEEVGFEIKQHVSSKIHAHEA